MIPSQVKTQKNRKITPKTWQDFIVRWKEHNNNNSSYFSHIFEDKIKKKKRALRSSEK